jgi:hypothetical protein
MEQLDLSNGILLTICAALALFVIVRLAQSALAEESRIRAREFIAMYQPKRPLPPTPPTTPSSPWPIPYTRGASLPPRRPTLPPFSGHTALADPPTLPLPIITPPVTKAPATKATNPDPVARLTFQPLTILTVSPSYLRQPHVLN